MLISLHLEYLKLLRQNWQTNLEWFIMMIYVIALVFKWCAIRRENPFSSPEKKKHLNVFIKFHMIDNCKHVFTPMIKFIFEFTKKISSFAPINRFEMKYVPYANVIGSLMYLVINILSNFVHRLVVLIMANPCGPLH